MISEHVLSAKVQKTGGPGTVVSDTKRVVQERWFRTQNGWFTKPVTTKTGGLQSQLRPKRVGGNPYFLVKTGGWEPLFSCQNGWSRKPVTTKTGGQESQLRPKRVLGPLGTIKTGVGTSRDHQNGCFSVLLRPKRVF